MRVLVLSQAYEPHRVVSWERAVVLYFNQKAEILESYDEELRSPSLTMKMPAVVRLLRGVRPPRRLVKFSRVNVFTRDGFRCQYCGAPKKARELSYDHVIPRQQGGPTTWENVVSACLPCNGRKANRTPEQAGMKLSRPPVRPAWLPTTRMRFDPREIPGPWTEWCHRHIAHEHDDRAA